MTKMKTLIYVPPLIATACVTTEQGIAQSPIPELNFTSPEFGAEEDWD